MCVCLCVCECVCVCVCVCAFVVVVFFGGLGRERGLCFVVVFEYR